MNLEIDCATVLAVCCVIAAAVASSRGGGRRLALLVVASYGVLAVLNALVSEWPWSALDAGVSLAWLWIWWNRKRPRRRKSLRQLGHKARAALAAIAGNMPKPGPSRRLAPQGSHA